MYSLGKYVVCVFYLFIFGNCTYFHKISKVESEQKNISKKQIFSGITRIPPNTCCVEATVVELDSSELISYSKKPCEIAPCAGIIRINSVIGYGSDFGTPLNLNDKLSVRFRFTTGPTKKVYPDSKKDLPGLSEDVTFIANINSSNITLVSGEIMHEYVIGEYEIIIY